MEYVWVVSVTFYVAYDLCGGMFTPLHNGSRRPVVRGPAELDAERALVGETLKKKKNKKVGGRSS